MELPMIYACDFAPALAALSIAIDQSCQLERRERLDAQARSQIDLFASQSIDKVKFQVLRRPGRFPLCFVGLIRG